MSNDEKIFFLEKLLCQAEKRLKELGCPNEEFFLDNHFGILYELRCGPCIAKIMNEKTKQTYQLTFVLSYEPTDGNIKTIIRQWKKSHCKDDEETLLEIVNQMEDYVDHGWSIAFKFTNNNLVPGIVAWHANVPIEQLAIELDLHA